MSRLTTTLALLATSTLGLSAEALAGGCGGGGGWRPVQPPIYRPIQPPAPTIRLRPISQPVIAPPVAPARQWYFGMSLQITQTPYGRGLQVASVTPGSPASLAGLEPGDTLVAAGQVNLQNAYSNEHGVQLLQSSVGGAVPTAAVTTRVVPPSPSVLLTVIDIRSGQPTHVSVTPIPSGAPIAGPAPTATF